MHLLRSGLLAASRVSARYDMFVLINKIERLTCCTVSVFVVGVVSQREGDQNTWLNLTLRSPETFSSRRVNLARAHDVALP